MNIWGKVCWQVHKSTFIHDSKSYILHQWKWINKIKLKAVEYLGLSDLPYTLPKIPYIYF